MFRPFVSLLLALLTVTAPASATEPAKHPGFEFTVGESKIKLYGFARLDLFYDDSKPNDPQTIQWIRSESESDSLPASEWTGLPDGTDNRVNLYGQFSF